MHVFPLRIIFLVIALLSALGNLGVPFVLRSLSFNSPTGRWDAPTVWAGVLNGLLIGEFVAIAVWILFDSMSPPKKLLVGAFLGFVLAACLIGGFQVWPGMPVQVAVIFLLGGSAFPSVFTGLLYCVAKLTTPKMVQSPGITKSAGRSRQYGIGSLFVLMIMVALVATIIRAVIKTTTPNGGWSSLEMVCIGLWCAWLAIGATIFVWFPIAVVSQPSLIKVAVTLLLVALGPSLFQWISNVVFRAILGVGVGVSTTFFPAVPQSISFGLLATSLLLGAILRFCVCKEPEVAIDLALQR